MACLLPLSLLSGRVALRAPIVSHGRRARLRFHALVWRVFVGDIDVVCAPRLLFNRWEHGCVFVVRVCNFGSVVDCGRFSCRCSGKGRWSRGAV